MAHEYVERSTHRENSLGERRIANTVEKMANIQSPNSQALSMVPMTGEDGKTESGTQRGKGIAKVQEYVGTKVLSSTILQSGSYR